MNPSPEIYKLNLTSLLINGMCHPATKLWSLKEIQTKYMLNTVLCHQKVLGQYFILFFLSYMFTSQGHIKLKGSDSKYICNAKKVYFLNKGSSLELSIHQIA